MSTDLGRSNHRLLTVVIPVFNTNIHFISQALDSVSGQSLDNKYYDIVIVDDGSTNPETCEFLNDLDQNNNYQGVALTLIRHEENLWLAQARITGATATDAEFILFLDSDDYIASDYLKKTILLLQSHPGAAWVYPSVSVFGQYHEVRIADTFKPLCFFLRNKTPYASVFRRSVWLKVLQRDRKVIGSVRFFEDWDAIIRLMAKGCFGTPLRDSTLFYRKHTTSLLNRSTKLYLLSIYTTWHANLLKFPLLFVSYMRNRHFQKKFKGEFFGLSPNRLIGFVQKRIFRQALEEPELPVVLDLKSLFFAFFTPSIFKKRFLDSNKTITLAEIRCGFLRKPSYDELTKAEYNSNQENILFAHTWWTVGGAEKVLLEWIKTTSKQLNSHKILDLCHLSCDSDIKPHFTEFVDEQYCLQDTGSTPYERLAYCWNLICHDRPQIIFISGNTFLYALSPLIKKYFPETTLVDILHNEWNSHTDWFNVAAEYQQYIDCRLVISEHWRQVLVDKYQENPEKVHVAKNFIDTNVFNPANYSHKHKETFLDIDNDKCIVAFVGRLHEQKAPDIFLKVAERMRGHNEYHFIMVGGGPLEQQVAEACSGLSNVTYFGEKTNVADFLAVTDILLCTSKYEGYPLVSLEAAAMQVPVIAPDIIGFEEQINTGEFGFLYPVSGQADNDAEIIATLLKTRKQEILESGSKGPSFIAKHHDAGLIRSKQESFLDNLLISQVKKAEIKKTGVKKHSKTQKKTLYLHVGMHKTGTTTIQHFLYRNRKSLSMSGLLYPSRNTYGYAHHETSEFFDTKQEKLPDFIEDRYKTRESWENAINAQKREMLLSSVDKFVLSSEAFSRCNHATVSDFYRDFDTKIIIFLRRQDIWFESMLNQDTKMRMNMNGGIEGHFRRKEKFFDYYQLLSIWADHFGKENLIVVPFQKSSFSDGLEKTFLQLVDIPWNALFQLQQAKNTRLNRDSLAYLEGFPANQRVRNPQFHRIIELLQHYSQLKPDKPEYKFTFSPEERLSLLEKYRESNQRVAKEFLHLESGVLFDESEPTLQEPWLPYPGLDEANRNKIAQYLHEQGIANQFIEELL